MRLVRCHRVQEGIHLGRRPQVMNALMLASAGDELPVLGRQTPVTQPEHPIPVDCAPEHRAALRPSFRGHKEALQQAFGHPQNVRVQRQIDVDERVRRGEPLPGGRDGTEAIDDDSSRPNSSACAFRYSSSGTSPPPARYLIMSSG